MGAGAPIPARWDGPTPAPGAAGGGRTSTEKSDDVASEQRPPVATRAVIAVVEVYRRWISPLFLPHCRFHPTCSAYAVGALRTHGLLRGTWLATVRLAKCAPWHPGGLDPVPPQRPFVPTAPRGAGAPITEERTTC